MWNFLYYRKLCRTKGGIEDKGYYLLSDTDSEVLLYIIYDYLMQDSVRGVFEATKLALKRVIGAYSVKIAMVWKKF